MNIKGAWYSYKTPDFTSLEWLLLKLVKEPIWALVKKKIQRQSNPLSKLLERQMNRVLSELGRKCSVGNGCSRRSEKKPYRAPSGMCVVGAVHSHGEKKPLMLCLSPSGSRWASAFFVAFAEWLKDDIFDSLWGLFLPSAWLSYDEWAAKESIIIFLFVFLFFLVICNPNMYTFCNVKRNFIGKSRPKPEMKHGHSWVHW